MIDLYAILAESYTHRIVAGKDEKETFIVSLQERTGDVWLQEEVLASGDTAKSVANLLYRKDE